jgi:beta-galactosidase
MGEPAPIAGESFIRAFERALLARGVPFAYAGGEALDAGIRGASWIVCTTAGGLKREVFETIRGVNDAGIAVTIGPAVTARDGAMRTMNEPHDVRGLAVESLEDPARADALVARYVEELALPTYPVDPATVFVSVLEDDAGVARVAFVMNPEPEAVVATLGVGRAKTLVDLLPKGRDPARIDVEPGGFVVEVPARTVRMFAIEA